MDRNPNVQTLAWFWDLHNRELLDLEPPYQRRSVWNQQFKDHFIGTVLYGYPCPAIFLYQDVSPDGILRYSVVDGKQRLSALFSFANAEFPVSHDPYSAPQHLRGRYFTDMDDDTTRAFWLYRFTVEYIPSTNEAILSDVFNRINRNVARLTPQELRHARYSGKFITATEELTEWMMEHLPQNFPNLAPRSQRQMKDVELVAQLLLLLEEGPRSYSQDELDKAFSDRDDEWDQELDIREDFTLTVETLVMIARDDVGPLSLTRTRFRNQADFYSLFGAVAELPNLTNDVELRRRLHEFIEIVEDAERRIEHEDAKTYYQYVRSASNDAVPRRRRVEIIKNILEGAQRDAAAG